MSRFTPLVKKEYVFEDDTVVVTFSRLKRKDVMALLPQMVAMKDGDKTAALNSMMDIMPQYIVSISGLVDATGIEVSKDMIFEDVYFTGLAVEISMDVLSESMPMVGEQAKNA